MSQSDYLKYRKIGTILQVDTVLNKGKKPQDPVFSSGKLLDYKVYTLENKNSSVNTLPTFNCITTIYNSPSIFKMNIAPDCSLVFPIYVDTNTRTNRTPLSKVYSDPTPLPMTIYNVKKAKQMKTDEYNSCWCPPIPTDYWVHFDATASMYDLQRSFVLLDDTNGGVLTASTTATLSSCLVANSINGLPCFKPYQPTLTKDFMLGNSVPLNRPLTTYTLFSVMTTPSSTTTSTLYSMFSSSPFNIATATSYLGSGKVSNTQQNYAVYTNNAGAKTTATNTTALSSNVPIIITIQVIYTASSSSYKCIIRINGIQKSTTTISSATITTPLMLNYFLLGNTNTTGAYFSGLIGETYLYGRQMTYTEMTTIEGNLSKKWGISVY